MLGLGLAKSNTSRVPFDILGYNNLTSSFWTHDLSVSSTSLDDLEHLCVIVHFSWSSYGHSLMGPYNMPSVLHAMADQSNDTGFIIETDYMGRDSNSVASGDFRPKWTLSDGSGPGTDHMMTPTASYDKARYANNWATNHTKHPTARVQDCFSSSPNVGLVYRFNASQTNDSTIAVFCNQHIEVDSADTSSVANLGSISNKVNIQINNDDGLTLGASYPVTDFTQPTLVIHKISVWNENITDAKIMTMMGFDGETFETTTKENLNGFYSMQSRFKPYSDFGVNNPAHEWDFSKAQPKVYASGTLTDTGETGGLDMTPSGNPPVGSRGRNVD